VRSRLKYDPSFQARPRAASVLHASGNSTVALRLFSEAPTQHESSPCASTQGPASSRISRSSVPWSRSVPGGILPSTRKTRMNPAPVECQRGIRACPGTSAPPRVFPSAGGKENRHRNLGGSIGSTWTYNRLPGQVPARLVFGKFPYRPGRRWQFTYNPFHGPSLGPVSICALARYR
jgi:hypothetical protein